MLNHHDTKLEFSFPRVHACARFELSLESTLVLPDDGRDYGLTPPLGELPLVKVEGPVAAVLGPESAARGGVAAPLARGAATWLRFTPNKTTGRRGAYPVAIKVGAGMRSAITAGPWSPGLTPGDYCVAPPQQWVDGYAVERGLIRQFVAADVDDAATVETQLTGAGHFGGLQVEVVPMRGEVYERLYPYTPEPVYRGGGVSRGGGVTRGGGALESFSPKGVEQGFAAGGLMRQRIEPDPYGLDVWDLDAAEKVFIHVLTVGAWYRATGRPAPAPPSRETYARYGVPWFPAYGGDALGGKGLTGAIKSVGHFEPPKGNVPGGNW